ncbi:MADS-box transcription factor 56-like [Abeliophyllum distichum]|uniref:MADS-box transcription factor 56-like n=1 Tax=Abeliophyllum distichum TaxID=126358 RepID=A0ABD1NRC9_9LAMI
MSSLFLSPKENNNQTATMSTKKTQKASAIKKSFKTRKESIKKKTMELSVLCDVNACAVIIGPDGSIETWPEDRNHVQQVIQQQWRTQSMASSRSARRSENGSGPAEVQKGSRRSFPGLAVAGSSRRLGDPLFSLPIGDRIARARQQSRRRQGSTAADGGNTWSGLDSLSVDRRFGKGFGLFETKLRPDPAQAHNPNPNPNTSRAEPSRPVGRTAAAARAWALLDYEHAYVLSPLKTCGAPWGPNPIPKLEFIKW